MTAAAAGTAGTAGTATSSGAGDAAPVDLHEVVVMRKVGVSWIALACVACLLLAACGGGTPSRPSASSTRTPRPSPSLTISKPTGAPTATQPGTPTPTASPTPTATATPTGGPTNAPTPTASESPSSTDTSAASTDEGTDIPAWAWWLLGLLLVALAVGVPLIVRARRRAAWAAELATASEEVAWFARVLLPQLQSASSVDQLSGGWSVGLARVTAVQDQLTALAATARRDVDEARATQLRDAVREAREGMDGLVASRTPGPVSQDVASIAAHLEAALAVATP